MEASSAITRTFLWVLRKMRWISVSVASGRGTRMTKVQTHLRAARPVCGWQLDADLVLAVFLAARGNSANTGRHSPPLARTKDCCDAPLGIRSDCSCSTSSGAAFGHAAQVIFRA
jgi:hypothetical protein